MKTYRSTEVIQAAQWNKPGDLDFVVPYNHVGMTPVERAYNAEHYGTVYNGNFGSLVSPSDWVGYKNGQYFVYDNATFHRMYAPVRGK